MARTINPIQDIYVDIEKIMDFIVVKNAREAERFETMDMAREASLWIGAMLQRDTHLTYAHLYEPWMFQENPGSHETTGDWLRDPIRPSLTNIQHWINNPMDIPVAYRENLVRFGRDLIINGEVILTRDSYGKPVNTVRREHRKYVERNDYYRMLMGLPPMDTPLASYVYLPDDLQESLNAFAPSEGGWVNPRVPGSNVPERPNTSTRYADRHDARPVEGAVWNTSVGSWMHPNGNEIFPRPEVPIWVDTGQTYRRGRPLGVHELDVNAQNRYMATQAYRDDLERHPTRLYLRFLGRNRIDGLVARMARDFQLIRYVPLDRNDINPHLVKEFADVYNSYRDYFVFTIYNRELEGVFDGYRSFMSLIMTANVLNQVCGRAVERAADHRFMDDTIIQTLFDMYGIPRRLVFTRSVRRELAVNLKKLIRNKATNMVYYELIRILQFRNTNVRKLMLMRAQKYDDNGKPLFRDGETLDTLADVGPLGVHNQETGHPVKELDVELSFRAVDLKSKDPWNDIITDRAPEFDYDLITDPDPQWWELPDTQHLVQNRNYNMADSKYIVLEHTVCQNQFLFEAVFFPRMILDNLRYTEDFTIYVPEIFGTTGQSVFDLVLLLLAAQAKLNGLRGEIISSGSGLLAVAGFNFDLDIGKFREWLETTQFVDQQRVLDSIQDLSMTTPADINRLFNEMMIPLHGWIATEISQTPSRREFLEYEKLSRSLFTYDIVREVFVEGFDRPSATIQKRLNISPQDWAMYQAFYPHRNGRAMTVTEFPSSDFDPFLTNSMSVTWNMTTPDGVLYFHDILNSPDLRFIRDSAGRRTRNPIFTSENGDVDWDKANTIISRINTSLSAQELNNAFFRVDTTVSGGLGWTETSFPAGTVLPLTIRNEVFREILTTKIRLDMLGEAEPPGTFAEYLRRRNPAAFQVLERLSVSRDDFLNDMVTIIHAIEQELDMQLRYYELSVVGEQQFFRPLVTMIRYFKSIYVEFARISFRLLIGDRIDAGGLSMMLRMFDEIGRIHWRILTGEGTPGSRIRRRRNRRRRPGIDVGPGPTPPGGGDPGNGEPGDRDRDNGGGRPWIPGRRRPGDTGDDDYDEYGLYEDGTGQHFGLYDTEHCVRHILLFDDRPEMIFDKLRTRIKWFLEEEEEQDEMSAYQMVPVSFEATESNLYYDGGEAGFVIGLKKEEIPIIKLEWKQVTEFTIEPKAMTHPGGEADFDVRLMAAIHSASPEAAQIREWKRVVRHRQARFGSMRMVDEARFFVNGVRLLPYKFVSTAPELDGLGKTEFDIAMKIEERPEDMDPSGHSSMWFIGEDPVGRYAHHHDFKMAIRKGTEHIQLAKIDREGWKEFVEDHS